MAVTTTRINFPAPNPQSGTITSIFQYTYVTNSGGSYLYGYTTTIRDASFSQSTSSANLNSLGIPDGAQIISVLPHATIPNGETINLQGSYFMGPQNAGTIKDYLNSLSTFNRTLSVTYATAKIKPDPTVTQSTYNNNIQVPKDFNYSFTACYLDVVWIPAGESIPEAEDPIHENTDSNALFVINPYGSAKKSCGVGVGGWPVGDSASNPTYDCFMKTVFKKPVTIANSSYVYQTPVWKDTYGMLGTSYTYRMVNNEIYGAPQFCRVNGTVYVRGYITRSTAPNGAVIFTLPENYRPSQQLTKWCYYEQGSASTAKGYAQVTVKTNGEVTLDSVRPWGNGGAAINTTSSFVNLDFNFRL